MLAAVALFAAWTAAAFPEVPEDRWSVDQADVLTPDEEAAIERRVDRLHAATNMQVAVVTADDVDGTPYDFSVALFNHWGVGDRTREDGLLLLLVVDQRRLELRTGRGVSGRFPDAWVDTMQRESMIPPLKEGRYADGLLAGMDRIEQQWAAAVAPPVKPWREPIRGSGRGQRSRKADRRTIPPEHSRARLLGLMLLAGLVAATLAAAGNRNNRCPRCQRRTITRRRTVLKAATTEDAGRVQTDATCRSCSYRHSTEQVIPPLPVVARHTAQPVHGSYDPMGGSSWGGSRGGSSSSGGGWGGGSTGGGGAGNSW